MNLADPFRDYIKLVVDSSVKAELEELTFEYMTRAKTTSTANPQLFEQYITKARKIAKPCINNKGAYEELVWKHNIAINTMKMDDPDNK